MINPIAALWLVFLPFPAAAEPAGQDIAEILAEAGEGTRWGVMVADAEDGREVVAINPDGRFMPASNTKIFTTAAALWSIAKGEGPQDQSGGANVRLVPAGRGGLTDVVLAGFGDAMMSGAADCVTDCLTALADAIALQTRKVRNVVGDATAFPDQRWSPGMSWNNMPTRSGTGISALSIDDNEIVAKVLPGAEGAPPAITMSPYYTLENYARTVPGAADAIGYDRVPGSKILMLTGTIGADSEAVTLRLGVDDPAHYAAWQLARMLRERGVTVSGEAVARHRALLPEDDPASRADAAPASLPAGPILAALTPPPLGQNITLINKISQNLHAELLLRRLGLVRGTGSIADGQAVILAMLDEAGVPARHVSLSDGSGMSSYNRVSPRGMVRLLQWIMRRPWGEQFQATLPIGGQDGTLSLRFTGTALEGKIAAKTGSLNATSALAGYLTASSGKRFVFAIYANDVPDDVSATKIMDKALVFIADAL